MIVDANIHVEDVTSIELYEMFFNKYTLILNGDIDVTLTPEQVQKLFKRMKELQVG